MKRWVVIIGAAMCSAGCITIRNSDSFPVASPVLDSTALAPLALPGYGIERRSVPLDTARGQLSVYYARSARSRGTFLFMGGSGNDPRGALRVLLPWMRRLGLDLVVFSYYDHGAPMPSVSRIRTATMAIYAMVADSPEPAARSIFVAGHSLGAWFALDLATRARVQGLIVAGAGTTPADLVRAEYGPLTHLVALRLDGEERQLDALQYAGSVRVPALVVTSTGDADVPSANSHRVFDAIPSTTRKELVTLIGFSHSAYFSRPEFWQAVSAFFGLSLSQN